jgi:hypothetical protein
MHADITETRAIRCTAFHLSFFGLLLLFGITAMVRHFTYSCPLSCLSLFGFSFFFEDGAE